MLFKLIKLCEVMGAGRLAVLACNCVGIVRVREANTRAPKLVGRRRCLLLYVILFDRLFLFVAQGVVHTSKAPLILIVALHHMYGIRRSRTMKATPAVGSPPRTTTSTTT